jgi:hypothetical protein
VLLRAESLLAAYGSAQVREKVRTWSDACRRFGVAMNEAEGGSGGPFPSKEMRDERDAVLAFEDELRAAIREDLEHSEESDG